MFLCLFSSSIFFLYIKQYIFIESLSSQAAVLELEDTEINKAHPSSSRCSEHNNASIVIFGKKMPRNGHAKERPQPGINQTQPDSKLLVSKDLNRSGEIYFGTLLHIFPTSAAHCLSGVTLLIY